jgi:ribosomal protein L11 methyltransferase
MYLVAYSETPEGGRELADRINACLPFWSEAGAIFSDVEEFELAREEWSEVWKKYFHIIHIADNLVIRPSWLEYDPQPGQAVVNIDPGMSFGTGQHATTLFCLQMIDFLAGKPEIRSLLDAGCGSAILTIAGAKMGYGPIDCFDYDPDAVMIAAENLELNQVSGITPVVADAAVYQGREGGYDFVCANILGHLLKAYRRNIITWVRPGGYLALAGILSKEFDELSQAFTELGFEEVRRGTLKEWTSGLFRKVE